MTAEVTPQDRETAQRIHDEHCTGWQCNGYRCNLMDAAVAALATARRAAWATCPEDKDSGAHRWHSAHCEEQQPCSRITEWGDYCNWCGVYRVAIDGESAIAAPADRDTG